jgi:hypothetical protein
MNKNTRWVVLGVIISSTGLAMTSPAIGAEQWNACEMLRQSDVDAGTLGKSVVKSSPKLAAVLRCPYTSAGATPKDRITVSLLARRAPSDTTGVTPQSRTMWSPWPGSSR